MKDWDYYKMNEEFINRLKKIASRTAWNHEDDFSVYDYCGGNYDDAYYGGYDDGETHLAREILEQLEK